MKAKLLVVICSLSILLAPITLAQQPTPQRKHLTLTIDCIMRGPRLVGSAPTNPYWSQDSQRVYFRWKQADEPRLKETSLYVVNRDGSGLRRLSEEEARMAPPANGDLSKDKKKTVFAEDGNIFLYDHLRAERRSLIKTNDPESNPHFTFDQKSIYFTRQNNLFVMALADGSLEQLTDIRSTSQGGSATTSSTGVGINARVTGGQQTGNEGQDFLKKEERTLLDAIRERAEQREEQEAKRKARESRKPFNLPAAQSVTDLNLSPNGKFVIATISEPVTGAKGTIVPNYVTESGYTEDIPGRSKAGEPQNRTRLLIIDVDTGEARNIDHGQRQSSTQTTEQPQRETTESTPSPEPQRTQQDKTARSRDRDVQLFQPQWSDDGKNAVLLARSADNKDRWVLLLDATTGKTTVLSTQHDDAWVGGPGSFTLGWLPDNNHVYFESERDGYAHLYSTSIDGGDATQLTSGQFEVSDVRLSRDKSTFFFSSSEGSPFERHLYSMSINGGVRTRLTTLPGNNNVDISPDETMLADIRSYSNKPPELYLLPNRRAEKSSEAKSVTTSPIPSFLLTTGSTRASSVLKRGMVRLYTVGSICRPHGNEGDRRYCSFMVPAIYKTSIVGGVTTIVNTCSITCSWSAVLLSWILTIGGSAGYGRDWRTGIYRHMGGKDLSDHVDAVSYLIKEHGVDPKRVGLYGGSYGGFITLMAMFTEPDTFAAGAALRPVTDWAHYANQYTANILNLPQNDAEAYRKSSPIYFANGLKGALLICHGMVDTNVNFQDSVRLVEKLIELRKENWEIAPYPVEDHGFEREESWADEYKRILKLFVENLKPGTITSRPYRSSTN
jgi:dipeptidyl aminopeptidase/acylaminoacyl peptidase